MLAGAGVEGGMRCALDNFPMRLDEVTFRRGKKEGIDVRLYVCSMGHSLRDWAPPPLARRQVKVRGLGATPGRKLVDTEDVLPLDPLQGRMPADWARGWARSYGG